MEVLVVAGEASGDALAGPVLEAMRARNRDLRFFGMGGPCLESAGLELLYSMRELSVMGISEVLPRLPRIHQILNRLTDAARARRPSLALLVDAPDFNLRLAQRLKKLGIPVVTYVAPTVWAWREGRTKTIRRWVDQVLCILPFEVAFLRDRGVDAPAVGHPALDARPSRATPAACRHALGLPEGRLLAVLPGSRPSEVRRLFPCMLRAGERAARASPGLRMVVPIAPGLEAALLHGIAVEASLPPFFVSGRSVEVLRACDAAIVASGTATLEAAIVGCPQVVVYRVSAISYALAKAMVHLRYASLVNILAGREVVVELLQKEATSANIASAIAPLWEGSARAECLSGYAEVRDTLGPAGATERVCKILEALLELRRTRQSPLPSRAERE